MYDKLFVNHSSVLSELLHFRANDFGAISAAQLSSVWLVVPLASKSSCPDLQTGAKLCPPWVMPCQRSDGGDGAEFFQHQLPKTTYNPEESGKTAAAAKDGCRKYQSSLAHTKKVINRAGCSPFQPACQAIFENLKKKVLFQNELST